MRFFALAGLAVLVILLWQFWYGESGWQAVRDFSGDIAQQEREAHALAERNRRLKAEILALKEGHAALEARARTDLGMVREGETFFQVVEPGPGGEGS